VVEFQLEVETRQKSVSRMMVSQKKKRGHLIPWYLMCTMVCVSINQKATGQILNSLNDSDVELWTVSSMQFAMTKSIKLRVEEQQRFKSNGTQFDRVITQVEGEYQPRKKWELGLGFRYIGLNDNVGKDQRFESYFRYHIHLGYKFKKKRFLIPAIG